MLATYVYNHCNICNIPIYFCNIRMKHLQHTYETLKIYVCNMSFSPFFRTTQSRAGNGQFRQSAGEDGGATWQWAAALGPSLGQPVTTPSPARRSVSAMERAEGGRRRSYAVEMEEGVGEAESGRQ